MEENNIGRFLPLSEATLYILLSLAPGPRHGYAIAKEVQVLSKKRVVLSISTLYTTLKRLLEEGWIARAGDGAEPDGPGRPRKTYVLTERGRRTLAAEKERLTSLLAVVRRQAAKGTE